MRLSLSAAVLSVAVSASANVAFAQPGAQTTFQTYRNPGGGEMITAVLGRQPSLKSASAAMLRRIHSEFGTRPAVVQTARNPDGRSAALVFTDVRNGQRYVGISLVNVSPNEPASGAALYDTAQRFPSTVRPMLHRLDSITNAQAAGPMRRTPIAPAEPLEHHVFTDGTGSMDLPADWKLTNGGGGSASAVGPTGEIVTYNLALTAMDTSNQTGANYLRGLPAGYRAQLSRRTAFLPYTGDPVQAWTTAFEQLARQNGRPAPSFHVTKSTPIGTGGIHLTEIVGSGTIPGIAGKSDDAVGSYVAFVQVTPPDPMGQWTMYSTFVYVPNDQLNRYGATAGAVMQSVRINFGVVNAESAAIRQAFQRSFDALLARSQQKMVDLRNQTNAFLANQADQQEGMHKWAVSMENFAGDRTTIVSTVTGFHNTVDSSVANMLVYPGSDFRTVPPSELLKGIDY